VRTGDHVKAGDVLGEVRDLFGEVLQTVGAPEDGVVLFLTTSAAVTENGLLMGLGCD
jgi:predicted deacylase